MGQLVSLDHFMASTKLSFFKRHNILTMCRCQWMDLVFVLIWVKSRVGCLLYLFHLSGSERIQNWSFGCIICFWMDHYITDCAHSSTQVWNWFKNRKISWPSVMGTSKILKDIGTNFYRFGLFNCNFNLGKVILYVSC